jgi:hypothetical protein
MRDRMTEQGAAMPMAPTGELLLPHNDAFGTKFNRTDFMFNHGLADHPLFELPALVKLAGRIPRYQDFVYWQNGRVDVAAQWGENPAPRLSLEHTIENIAHNNSLVLLKHVDQDPVYGPVMQEILQRVFSLAPPDVRQDITIGETLIFINSPRRKTPYHIDLEANCLLQVSGSKVVYVFDAKDRSITPDSELEEHCAGQHGAVYKPLRQSEAHAYDLVPGRAVHFPSLAPHWVENGDEVSVSINVNYDLKSVHHKSRRIYRVNRIMRQLGIEPVAPGHSPLRDMLKQHASRGVGAVRDSLRRIWKGKDPAESYPVWRPTR